MLLSFLSYIQQHQAKASRDVMRAIPPSSLEKQHKYKVSVYEKKEMRNWTTKKESSIPNSSNHI